MKKFILCLLAFCLLTTPVFAGGLWDVVKNSDLTTLKSRGYQLEVKGVNTRVYVFKVPEMNSVCTITYGGGTTSQLECKTYKEMGTQ